MSSYMLLVIFFFTVKAWIRKSHTWLIFKKVMHLLLPFWKGSQVNSSKYLIPPHQLPPQFVLVSCLYNYTHTLVLRRKSKRCLFWNEKVSEMVWDFLQSFLTVHILKPSLSDFAHSSPSYLILGTNSCCISWLMENSLGCQGCRQAVGSSPQYT